jgi:hypothetical protein
MKHSPFKWEMAGIGVIFLVGAFFNFILGLCGDIPAVGILGPGN